MPFLVQTSLIHEMGMEYVGLQGVFSSILSVLSVAELGIGSAIVYSMYDPIANDNKDSISALLLYYKYIYRKIGTIIFLLGIIITPFITMITGYIEEINIYVVFLLYLVNSVSSYFLYAYKSSLLIAYQRTDISNNIGTIISIGMSSLQIIVIIYYHNFYVHLLIAIIFTIINNLMISKSVDRLYPEYKEQGKINVIQRREIKKNVKGLMIAKICGTTRNMFDSIFISAFLGIVVAGIYSNYYYVLNAATAMLSVISPAIIGGVGNSIKLDSPEKNFDYMINLDFGYMLVSGWFAIILLCLYQPFMIIWAGNNNTFAFDIVVLFSLYFYIKQMGNIRAIFSDAAGLFWENRYRTAAEAISNIILNYILVTKYGVTGIIFATIFTLFIFGYIASAEVIFRCYFKNGIKKYFMNHFIYLVVTLVNAAITYKICSLIQGNVTKVFCVRILISVFVPIIIYYLIYHRLAIFKNLMKIVKQKYN